MAPLTPRVTLSAGSAPAETHVTAPLTPRVTLSTGSAPAEAAVTAPASECATPDCAQRVVDHRFVAQRPIPIP